MSEVQVKKHNLHPIWAFSTTNMGRSRKRESKHGGCEVFVDGGQTDLFSKDCEYEWGVDNFLSEDVEKVRFRYWSNWGFYDPESVIEEQWAFEIFPDGTVKYYAYPRESRRVLDKDIVCI